MAGYPDHSTTSFTYNDANEQTAMTVDGTTTNFAYDAWRYGSFLSQVTSDFPGEARIQLPDFYSIATPQTTFI